MPQAEIRVADLGVEHSRDRLLGWKNTTVLGVPHSTRAASRTPKCMVSSFIAGRGFLRHNNAHNIRKPRKRRVSCRYTAHYNFSYVARMS
jgi:hypothetical protein